MSGYPLVTIILRGANNTTLITPALPQPDVANNQLQFLSGGVADTAQVLVAGAPENLLVVQTS